MSEEGHHNAGFVSGRASVVTRAWEHKRNSAGGLRVQSETALLYHALIDPGGEEERRRGGEEEQGRRDERRRYKRREEEL